jgi:hypothetical protein
MIEAQDMEKPPLFKNWRNWYALVLLNLLVWCCLFYFITVHFR